MSHADAITFLTRRRIATRMPDDDEGPRRQLAEKIAGEITLSSDPGETLRKWRTDFDITQTELSSELDVSSSVISDYESGRRESPGIAVINRIVTALLDIDERRGGDHIRRYGRVLSAGFQSDVVRDLREYSTPVTIDRLYEAIGAEEVVAGDRSEVTGHTVINSVEAIRQLSSEEFFRLFGQSTSRVLIFTEITRGESPLVALRVVNPTPNAVVFHGIDRDALWEHAPELAKVDGVSLAVCTTDIDTVETALNTLP